MSIKDRKLLYHITDIKNLNNILAEGLLPRESLTDFVDVADQDILDSRQALKLEQYVPFHFFARNPFDGRVQVDNPDTEFVLIAVSRDFAKNNGWKVIPRHPLAGGDINLHEYDEGMQIINWDKMNERDYSDDESKSVCMAECLSPEAVQPSQFQSIYVRTEESQTEVKELIKNHGARMFVDVNDRMFLGK